MKMLILVALMLAAPLAGMAQQKERKLFSYDYKLNDLPNGLRLITVPTDYPNLVALYIVVSTGSRNEIEAGKSGYAHLFEHLMFRGSENYTAEQRDELLKRAGASSNAYTTYDRTVYHEVFSKEDLEPVLKLEADRFQRLKYPEAAYKTETRAVLGEYNKNSANPLRKLEEKLHETAFDRHTYSHTTMGYIKDIEDMPNQYTYSLDFYKRYYRPEYTTIVLVGDVKPEQALAITQKYFGDWKRGNYVPEIPSETTQSAPRTAHIDWPTNTLPHMVVAFRAPAFSDENKDKAALDLLSIIAFGENSDIYQQLVLKEQKVDFIAPDFEDRKDPELFAVYARVKQSSEGGDTKRQADVDYVRDRILATFERYKSELIPQDKLDQTRSRLRYAFALSMNSSEAIAGALAPYIALKRTPETINKAFTLYESVTPQDIRAAAARYFTERNRTIVTLSTKLTSKEGGK